MRIFRLALLLACLPLLPGCMTCVTMYAAKNGFKVLHEDNVHAEKAVISKEDGQLLIYLKGSITNSPSNSLFTLVIPAEIVTSQSDYYKEIVYEWPIVGTNGFSVVIWGVSRDYIHEGWLPEGNSNDVETVPVEREIYPAYTFPRNFGANLSENAWQLRNLNRALYQVRQPGYLEFIYTDPSSKRPFADFRIDPALDGPRTKPGIYLLLPVAVTIDVATSPIQIPLYIYWEGSHHQQVDASPSELPK